MGWSLQDDSSLSDRIRGGAKPWDQVAREGYSAMLEIVGDARLVLLGEASHGTHEFYAARGEITRRLIESGRCHAVAVEADWPDAYRINRYVRDASTDTTAEAALNDFQRFPQWMWRNTDVVEFIAWLRDFNLACAPDQRVGFYGLDLYSLFSSIDAVIAYLDRVDPAAAQQARARYGCFDAQAGDPERYGIGAIGGPSCEEEAVAQLIELRAKRQSYVERDGMLAQDEQFQAEQNARLVLNAERYYRGMFGSRVNVWNLRDTHMADTLDALSAHLASRMGRPNLVVWAHNSHLGDARATEMSQRGELNLGQLMRERHGREVVSIGFTTYDGTVAAASGWGEAVELKRVRPALPGSIEALLHQTVAHDCLINLRVPNLASALRGARLERAIGVIYQPDTERLSHYFMAKVAEQFDALIHFDRTRAVHPLEPAPRRDVPAPEEETFPSGI